MPRKLLVSIHLYLAAFLAPAFILLAISGGLYLLDNEGEIKSTPFEIPANTVLHFDSPTLKSDVKRLLKSSGVRSRVDGLKTRDTYIQTKPITHTFYKFEKVDGIIVASKIKPNLQKTMIELHKGHGPKLFKLYGILAALSLFFIVISGLWIGLKSKVLKRKTLLTSLAGLAVFFLLAY